MSRLAVWLVASSLAAAACGDGAPGGSLVKVEVEPEGDNCEFGGTVIHTGYDHDNDHELDRGEISSSQYICNDTKKVECAESDATIIGPVTPETDADFASLSDVTCIDGDLIIVGTSYAEIPGLPNLHTVTGSVVVAGNPAMQSVNGLVGVQNVGGKYIVQGNDSLTDLTGLAALRKYLTLAIVGNDSLVDLVGLSTFTDLVGGLTVSNNGSLVSLHGLENVTRGLRDRVTIATNRSLASVDALVSLRSAVLLEITGNATLASVSLPSLEKVDVNLTIKDNAAVTHIDLPGLSTTGALWIKSNPALTSLQAKEVTFAGSVSFDQNTSLASIDLPHLSYVTADFDITSMPALSMLQASSLVAIGGRLYLYRLADLGGSMGLDSLAAVGGNFTMQDCDSLVDFTGLSKLVDVAHMTITQNQHLASFSGLTAFSKVGGDLVITMNPELLIETSQAFASGITVVGNTTIN